MSDEPPGVVDYERVMATASGCPSCLQLMKERDEAREWARRMCRLASFYRQAVGPDALAIDDLPEWLLVDKDMTTDDS